MPTLNAIGRDDRPDMAQAPRRILITGGKRFRRASFDCGSAAAYPDAALLTPPIDVRIRDGRGGGSARLPDVCIHLAAISTVRGASRMRTMPGRSICTAPLWPAQSCAMRQIA